MGTIQRQVIVFLSALLLVTSLPALSTPFHAPNEMREKPRKKSTTRYGVASYYAKKFNGRRMNNGDIYRPEKMTAACNVLPLGTRIKVTNLRNHRSAIVTITDRMNRKNKRLVDLSQAAAKKLGYYARGLTRVKVEVIKK